jgi:hypothetical protein
MGRSTSDAGELGCGARDESHDDELERDAHSDVLLLLSGDVGARLDES